MYQAWQWGGTSAANPNAAGFVQPPTAGQVPPTQWPAGFNQYATLTPDMQQQWAAWQQYAYGTSVPVGQVPTTTTYTTAYQEYPPNKETQPQTVPQSTENDSNSNSAIEKSKNSAEELVPKDSTESKKLKELEEKAQQWKSSQQPVTVAASSYIAPAPVTTTSEALKSSTAAQAQFDKEEEEFEQQFKEWEKQFETWKEQNKNHPDKQAFAEYEKQWQEWRVQLLQKKEQMQKNKAERAAAAAATQISTPAPMPTTAPGISVPATTNMADVTVTTPNAGMYYPPAQYMYMQPYMYPGSMSVAPPPIAATAPAIPPQFPPYGPPPGQPPFANPPMAPPLAPPPVPDSSMPPTGMEDPNLKQNDPGGFNYGQGGEEEPPYAEYGNMYPPDMDEQYQRDQNFGRGRARGRGRGHGRGRGRWDGEAEGMRGPGLLDPPNFPKGPAVFDGPTGDFGGPPPPNFRDGPRDFNGPPEGPERDGAPFNYPDGYQGDYPPDDMNFPEEGPRSRRNFPPERFPFRDGPRPFRDGQGPPPFHEGQGPPFHEPPFDEGPPFPDEQGPPFNDEQGPPFREGQRPFRGGPRSMSRGGQGPFRGGQGPPFRGGGQRPPFRDAQGPPFRDGQGPPFRDGQGPPFRDGQGPPFRDGQGPPFREGQGPPFRDGHGPPFRDGPGPPFRDGQGPPFRDGDKRPFRDRPLLPEGPPHREGPPPRDGPKSREPPLLRDKPLSSHEGRSPALDDDPPLHRYPPDELDEEFPPEPPFEERFPPESERNPPESERIPPDVKGGRMRERFPPPDDGPFREDFPPFEERFPSGRGRFPGGRGRRMPPGRGDFDRFPPFMQDRDEPYGPDDRFPPRMPPGRGPPFEPEFPDEPFMRDGPPPIRFKTVDYTHRPASDILGDEFNRRYEHEAEFQEDISQFRENFSGEVYLVPRDPIIFSKAKVESFDYAHGISPADEPPVKVFDYSHRSDRDSPQDRYLDKDRYREREREPVRSRERDRNRDNDRDKGRRDFKREREWDKDYRNLAPEKIKRSKWDSNSENKKTNENNSKKNSSEEAKGTESEMTLIEDILNPPKRATRPKQLVIILRGLPGSGKTYVAKLIKDKEIANGGSAPRILSLDDYFMAEVEVTDTDPETGKTVKRKEFKFEYESEMEESYRASLFKSFKKTIDDRFFPFIIVDAVHEKSKQYEQYWSYAKQRGFQVYIAEMDCKDAILCYKKNIHNRTLESITKILNSWEKKPRHFLAIDIRSLLQEVAITEVEMEVEDSEKNYSKIVSDEENDSNSVTDHVPSRWEKLEATEEKLDQLDGLRLGKKKHSSMEDYLQLPDDYEERKCEPGKKRVRWADLEERKEQDRIRAIGFVVGQTDWNKMTDPTHADRALTKTKYF